MVIPVTLDAPTQAAIDAARAAGDNTVITVPRLDGEYGPVGTTALIEKVGRLPTGEAAAVVRGLQRAHIGSGVAGPGAALWVQTTPFAEPTPTGRSRELAREYKTLVTSLLQRRGVLAVAVGRAEGRDTHRRGRDRPAHPARRLGPPAHRGAGRRRADR